MKKLVDHYLIYALPLDLIVVLIIFLCNYNFSLWDFSLNNKTTHLQIISSIIGSSISLAGFVLASLTIIVAIRSNVKMKMPERAESSIELFFSVGTYNTIVKVFIIAITELVICFTTAYMIWIIGESISNFFLFNLVISLIFLTVVSTIRSLFVLFLLISLDLRSSKQTVEGRNNQRNIKK